MVEVFHPKAAAWDRVEYPDRSALDDRRQQECVQLRVRLFRHDGNAVVIRQELATEHGIITALRSVKLKVRHIGGENKEIRTFDSAFDGLQAVRRRSTFAS